MSLLPPRQGRIAAPIVMSVVRELTAEDVFRLASLPIERSAPPALQRLKAPHRTAARMIAGGASNTEVALAIGRTPQRIGDLQKDPTFMELVAFYADQVSEAELEDGARLRGRLADHLGGSRRRRSGAGGRVDNEAAAEARARQDDKL